MERSMVLNNELGDQLLNNHSFIGFVSNEEMSSDLQKKLKRINKLPNGLYETKFKIDRYKFDRAMKNELSEMNSLQNLFQDIMTETGTQIMLHMKSKSNSKLRNPLVNVIGSLDGIEFAKERILSVFENIKMRVVLKMDVSYKDHSHIIGRGGFSIQRVMDDTGSHIHFPDSNRISDVKKSNVVLVCGSPTGVEQARCKIRNLLPLVVHFKIPLDCLKRAAIESYSKHLRSIQQVYNVHISIRYSHDIDEAYAAIFDSSRTSKYIAVSVRGANNDLPKLKESLSVLINRLTDYNTNLKIAYALTIEITEFYHQLVMGTNYFNVKNIMQQTNCVITFPDVETNQRLLDFDNLNEIPVNKSTVIIKGPSFEAVHQAWKELIGYLPLVLTFDLAHDQPLDTALLNQLKKQYKVAIFLKHKEKYNTIIIRGIEKNSKALFEVRKQLLKLEDADIPVCCENHGKIIQVDENSNEHSTILNNIISNQNSNGVNLNNLNLINGVSNNTANILNSKMMQSIDSNNNLSNTIMNNEKGNNLMNFGTNSELQNIFNPMLFQAVIQEQYLLLQQQQQLNQRQKQNNTQQPNMNGMFNNSSGNISNVSNTSLNEEVNRLLRQHSVNDLTSVQQNNAYQNDSINQSIKKELTSSCSSPSLNALTMQNNSANSSLINNFLISNESIISTPNTSITNTASSSNNSFNNGYSLSPTMNSNTSSSNLNTSSLANNQNLSPVINQNNNSNSNWTDQRRMNYDECRYLALKSTYEKPDINEVRIPSSIWSGLGFSKSMSHDLLRSKLSEWNPLFNSLASPANMNNNSNKPTGLTAEEIQKHANSIDKMNGIPANGFIWPEMIENSSTFKMKQRPLIKQESEICSTSHPYSSNYLKNLVVSDNVNQQFNGSTGINQFNGQTSNFNNSNPNGLNSKEESETFIDINKIDLATVLLEYGLFKYVDVFKQFKIDFAQFLSLTEEDLSKLGIHFVGRRKVYTAILELRKLLQSNFIGSNFNNSKEGKNQAEAFISKQDSSDNEKSLLNNSNLSLCKFNDSSISEQSVFTEKENKNSKKSLLFDNIQPIYNNISNSINNNDNEKKQFMYCNSKSKIDVQSVSSENLIYDAINNFNFNSKKDFEIRDDLYLKNQKFLTKNFSNEIVDLNKKFSSNDNSIENFIESNDKTNGSFNESEESLSKNIDLNDEHENCMKKELNTIQETKIVNLNSVEEISQA